MRQYKRTLKYEVNLDHGRDGKKFTGLTEVFNFVNNLMKVSNVDHITIRKLSDSEQVELFTKAA